MSLRKIFVCSVFSSLAAVALCAENVEQVAKRVMGIDVASIPFGATLKEHPEFTPLSQQFTVADLPTNIVWCSGDALEGWNSSVNYGFLDGRLYCVELATNSLDLTFISDKVSAADKDRLNKESEDRRKSKQDALNKLRDGLQAATKQFKAEHPLVATKFDDGNYIMQYMSACSPAENIVLVITIARSH